MRAQWCGGDEDVELNALSYARQGIIPIEVDIDNI